MFFISLKTRLTTEKLIWFRKMLNAFYEFNPSEGEISKPHFKFVPFPLSNIVFLSITDARYITYSLFFENKCASVRDRSRKPALWRI